MDNETLINEVAQSLNIPEEKVSEMVSLTVRFLTEKLAENTQVVIENFGVFQPQKKSEYILRDPESGERHLMPPHVEVGFKPAPQWEKRIIEKSEE